MLRVSGKRNLCWSDKETGSVLLIVAAAMMFLLAISALAIDLANFYLARAQAQRAADAAALAGASEFVQSGCLTTGCSAGGGQELPARQQAEAVGNHNYIAGQFAEIKDGDIAFSYPNPCEPQITVIAGRAVPTLFAKVFGINTVNINAQATAEAYNSACGGGAQVAVSCVKPFLVPNCAPVLGNHGANGKCVDPSAGYFFYPGTPGAVNQIEQPSNKLIGMKWQLHSEAGPSQWYLVGFNDAPPSSGAALGDHILQCTAPQYSCATKLTTANGNMVGKVTAPIEDLIHANGQGLGQGQDSIDTTSVSGYGLDGTSVFPITGGSNNPKPELVGNIHLTYSQSPSVVSIPVYQGGELPPGGTDVRIVGYLQVFIQDVIHNGQDDYVDVVILNATPVDCSSGTGSPPPGSTVVSSSGSTIPIRLIRTN